MSQDRYQRPPRPVRNSRRTVPVGPIVIALVTFVVLGVVFLLTAGVQIVGKKGTAAAAPVHSPTAPAKHRAGIGDAVRDGKFEFVVARVDCSRSRLGVEHLARTAKGKFCVVSLSVRNIGGTSQYFLGSAQKMTDAAGAKFGDDELAGLYVNQHSQTFLRKIAPGGRVTGKIVFDLPKSMTPAALELHDSFFSGGVVVTLK